MVALVRDCDDITAGADREENLGSAGKQRDDALRYGHRQEAARRVEARGRRRERSSDAISTAAMAASAPLLPCLPPARSSACSTLSVVRIPNPDGMPVMAWIDATPRAASSATRSKCAVSPRITAPTHTTASTDPCSASSRAATGISKLPGTHTTVMSSSSAPSRSSALIAPSSRRCVTISLKRPATTPIRIPVASSLPVCTVITTIVARAWAWRWSRSAVRVEHVEQVTELLPLRPQIALAVRGCRNHQRRLVGHLQPVAAEAIVLLRIVREHDDAPRSQIREDLRPDAVVTRIDGKAQTNVGLDGVEPVVLQRIGAELVHQTDAPALLSQVHQHAASFGGDDRHRFLQLRLAVAALGAEDIAGETLAVHAHQHRLAVVHPPPHQRDVRRVRDQILVAVRRHRAELGGQHGRGATHHETFRSPPVRG